MENIKRWYVVYTKPKYGRKVTDLLQKKKLKSYYPRYNEVQYWQERKRIISIPLFTSLVFVYSTEKEHSVIKQTEGVLGIMYWLHKPAVISNIEISSIRHFLEQYDNIKLEKIQIAADREDISDTNYSQLQPYGVVSFSNQHKMSLPSLGYALISESVAVEDVKIVA